MINKIAIGAALCAFTMLPSCGTLDDARQKVETMSQADFDQLRQVVHDTAAVGGRQLGQELNAQDKQLASQLLYSMHITLLDDNLGQVDDVVSALINRFSTGINDPDVAMLLQDALNLVDATVGQIDVGIDGVLSMREKHLVDALLQGVFDGIQSTV